MYMPPALMSCLAGLEARRARPATYLATSTPNCETPEEGADTIVWLGAASEPARSLGLLARPRAAPESPRTVDQGGTRGPRAAMGRMRAHQRLARHPDPDRRPSNR